MGNDQSSLSGGVLNAKAGDSANSIRKKVSRGYQFRMKVIVRGDRGTGKTQLCNRLLGKGFNPSYQQTAATQIGNITWDYQSTNDTINVEIWDFVESTRRKKRREGFKLSNADDEDDGTAATDPENMAHNLSEAMRGAAGVIFMFDPSKKWTWEYVRREVPGALATGAFVLIVANYKDCCAEGCVTDLECRLFVTEQQSPNLHYTEASMKNAFGIKSIATFFTIPFMVIQRAWIEAELRRNEEELRTSKEELDVLINDYTYETHLKQLADRRNAIKRAQEDKQQQEAEKSNNSNETNVVIKKDEERSEPKLNGDKENELGANKEKEKEKEVKEQELKLKKEKEAKERAQKEQEPKMKKEKEAKERAQKEQELKLKKEKEAKERAQKEQELKLKKEKEAKERAQKEAEEKARKEAAELEKKKKKGPTKEELKKQKMEQEASIAQLKELSSKGASSTMTVDDVDDFKPDDDGFDDSFFKKMGTKNDGWITAEPEEDVWGTGNIEDEVEEPQPPKKGGKQKKKKKQTIILDDEDDFN